MRFSYAEPKGFSVVNLFEMTNLNEDILNSEKIILGIDPGTTIMGFGLIKVVKKEMHFMQLNELNLKKI